MVSRPPFLTARWEHILLLNYRAPRKLLEPLVPRGTELDPWRGDHLISIVGFLFLDTRIRGVAFPGHRDFEEVNLRFYVRRRGPDGEWRRAVVFIRELVPRRAVAWAARWLYNEPYVAVPMSHAHAIDPVRGGRVQYGWEYGGRAFTLSASVNGPPAALVPGSEAEFITEHYWGYTKQRDGRTIEYRVEHPRWRVWTPDTASFAGSGVALYGSAIGQILTGAPRSAFLADGSAVSVGAGERVVASGRRVQRRAEPQADGAQVSRADLHEEVSRQPT
jgi:uncharacterized protein YqjF (DUF2071 family)